jgi:hypothetical protein
MKILILASRRHAGYENTAITFEQAGQGRIDLK